MREHTRLATVIFAALASGWFIVHAIKTSIVDIARVTNVSMLPYLKPQQLIAFARTTPCWREPVSGAPLWCAACEIGQAYVLEDPRAPERKLVKFAVHREDLDDVNWFTQSERAGLKPSDGGKFCYFAGSNREYSVDSRHFGPVPVNKILGRVIFPVVKHD